MKIQGGNIGKVDNTEDKIVRVEGPIPEDEPYIKEDILGVTRMLPPLSILQLSDVGIKTKKTFKGKAGKVLVVGSDEKSIEFGNGGGGGGGGDAAPITLTYSANLTVDLSEHLNYVLTLTGDCELDLTNIVPGWVYQFLIIQDNIGGHTITFAQTMKYVEGYNQSLGHDTTSKLIIDYINNTYFASIQLFQ